MSTRNDIKALADLLIATLSTTMDSDKADAIVRDVAEALYNDVLGIKGKIVVDQSKPTGIMHGSFGPGRRAAPIASFKFEEDKS